MLQAELGDLIHLASPGTGCVSVLSGPLVGLNNCTKASTGTRTRRPTLTALRRPDLMCRLIVRGLRERSLAASRTSTARGSTFPYPSPKPSLDGCAWDSPAAILFLRAGKPSRIQQLIDALDLDAQFPRSGWDANKFGVHLMPPSRFNHEEAGQSGQVKWT
jgi:hypothetical protein